MRKSRHRLRPALMSVVILTASVLMLASSALGAPQLAIPPSTSTISSQGGTVTFTFSEQMDPTGIDITWEGEAIDPTKFTCEWQDEMFGFPIPPIRLDCTYEGGLPPNAEISYTLNAGGSGVIKSQSGQALPETSGSFVTPGSAQSSELCFGITPEESQASAMIMKMVNYRQSGTSGPEFDIEEQASFFASVQNSNDAAEEATAVTLHKPDNSSEALTELSFSAPDDGSFAPDLPSQFFLSTSEPPDITYPIFDSEAALNAEFPDGSYSMTVELNGGGSAKVDLPLQSPDPFPAPSIRNFEALQDIDTGQSVTIEWDPLSGGGEKDAISIVIYDADGNVVFQAPDRCVEPPVELAPTAGSVTVPAGILEGGASYEGELSFYTVSRAGESTIQDFREFAASVKTTRFPIGDSTSPDETSLEFAGIEILENGDVKVTIRGTLASSQLTGKLQTSSDLETWSGVDTISKDLLDGSAGETEIVHSGAAAGGAKYRFYRVIVE